MEIGRIDINSSAINVVGRDQSITNNYYAEPGRITDEMVYGWLSAPIPSRNYNEAFESRTEDTCLWFVSGTQFSRWILESGLLLWVHGTPGCGKTVLSAFVIKTIMQYCGHDPASVCAYFFFDGRDGQDGLQRQDSLVRSLIRQLSFRLGAAPDHLMTLYQHCHDGGSEPSRDSLQDALQLIIDSFQRVYVVIDALDECTQRRLVLDLIKAMSTWKRDKLHVLITSRYTEDIARGLRSLDPVQVYMEHDIVQRDIGTYVDLVLKTDDAFEHWNPEIKQKIKDRLIDRAEGMFRLVSLQVAELQDCLNPHQLDRQLEALPEDLNGFYARTISGISEKHHGDVLKILQWLAFTLRPLRLDEAAQVVGTVEDPEYGSVFDPSRVYPDPRLVLHACSSLITEVDGNVKLAHMSVKEYLLSSDSHHGASHFHLDEQLSHSFIAQTCLAYLLQFNTLDMLHVETMQGYPLADYAARYWVLHAHLGSKVCSNMQLNLMNALLQSQQSPPFLVWVWLFDLDNDSPWTTPCINDEDAHSIPSPLYYASLAGLQEVVLSLLEKGMDLDAQKGKFHTALQAASARGHEAVVRLLLQSGAEVNVQGGHYCNALQAASVQGHTGIVKLLLERGADINGQEGEYGNALQAASLQGHKAVVVLLLENGAEINAQGGFYGSALQAASALGQHAVVKVLLDYGADISMQGGFYNNALHAASAHGHKAVVRLLLKNGADANLQGGFYGNALQAASAQGYKGIIGLLLEYGANINQRGGFYGNALFAAQAGNHQVIQTLLEEQGATTQGEFGNSILLAALSGTEI